MKKNKSPIYVLGTGLSHDGSACLLKDGEVCVAIEKERITRIKHDGHCDNESIQYCLDAEGITFDDISLVVQNANFHNFDKGNSSYRGQARIIPEHINIISISHHLAHAYSVVGTCPYDEFAIMIIDGCGSSFDDCIDMEGVSLFENPLQDNQHLFFEKDSFYVYKDGKLNSLCKDFSPFGYIIKEYDINVRPRFSKHSIGGLYSAFSQYVFKGIEDVGKLMGLAPFGNAGRFSYSAFDMKDGRIFVNYDWINYFDNPRISDDGLAENFQYYADVAYWVQSEIEKALLYLFKCRSNLTDCKNVGYAGGVALNAVANSKVVKQNDFENYYFQPAAGDNGLSLGCAYYGWLEVLKKKRVIHNGTPYFGKSYSAQELSSVIAMYSNKVDFRKPDKLHVEVAQSIADGKVIGWFESGSEFGPRALGHRSILADPRISEMQLKINRDIKFREDFRPFAPSVLVDKASIYFEQDCDSPYMILVSDTRNEWREKIPAVVHVDGSARVQTVNKELSPGFYRLINEFGNMTGVYLLLNTSLNKKGMPIVETPKEALDFFLECGLDMLVIDGVLIEKKKELPDKKTNDIWDTSMSYTFT